MRVLLTDGSGLTSKQVAHRLGTMGHRVEVLAPNGLCLSRFSRYVRNVHPVPAYGPDRSRGWRPPCPSGRPATSTSCSRRKSRWRSSRSVTTG